MPPPICAKKTSTQLVEHLPSAYPLGAPTRPVCVERVELGRRDEGRAGAQRLEVCAELRDLVNKARCEGWEEVTARACVRWTRSVRSARRGQRPLARDASWPTLPRGGCVTGVSVFGVGGRCMWCM